MRVALSQQLTPEQVEQAKALADSVNAKSWSFDSAESTKASNAPLFAYLAVTSDRPEVIGASVQALGLANHKMPAGEEAQQLSQPDLEAVIGDSLTSSFTRIQGRALDATAAVLRSRPNSDLGKQAVALLPSLTTVGAQYDLLKTISVLPPQRKRPLMDEFVTLLDNLDPLVAATLMEELTTAWGNASPPTALINSTSKALQHKDPLVRGSAARFLGTVGTGRPKVAAALIALLEQDESPFVLSEAATALARLGTKPAAHALVPLLDDKRSTRVEATPWQTLEGTMGRKVFGGPSASTTVGMVALDALMALSGGELKPLPTDPSAKDLGASRDVTAAKSWYSRNKTKIPKDVGAAEQTTLPASSSAPAPAKTAP